MAENYLITGYWGEPHVTSENDRGIHAAIFGAGRFVLPVGEQFAAEYIGNNTIRIADGKLMDNGAAAGIPAGEYVDLTIANASQGKIRNDLIVFQYEKNASNHVESGSFVVVQGTEASGTPSDPSLVQQDLLSGEATKDQMPLYRVKVNGTTISEPVKLFTMADGIKTAADVANYAKSLALDNCSSIASTKAIAEGAMPKYGGIFTGVVVAQETARYGWQMYNVQSTDIAGYQKSISGIWFMRK